MSPNRDLAIFLGIFILLFLLWLTLGGPSRPLSQGGTFLNPLPPIGEGSSFSAFGGSSGFQLTPGADLAPSSEGLKQRISELQEQFQTLQIAGDPSPYAGAVTLERSDLDAEEPEEEHVRLSVSRRADQPVPVTGWSIRSLRSNTSAEIGEGTHQLETGGVPQKDPITLSPGTTAYIVTGRSPVGTSFRTNACTGYLSQFQDFTPQLARQCPTPSDELETYPNERELTETCIEYVEGLRRCRMQPTTPPELENSCRAFLNERINYRGCFDAHNTESDFYKNEWRIYLGRGKELWSGGRETLLLTDENGMVVDVREY